MHGHKPNRFTVVPVVCELGRCPVHNVESGVETAAAAVSCLASKSSNSIVDPVKTLQIVLVCRKYEKSFNYYDTANGFLNLCCSDAPYSTVVYSSLFGRHKKDRE